MEITDKKIDGGRSFDWGKTSSDYAKYRDIYPQEFYDKIVGLGLGVKGQSVLDLGTGTGVIPRNMYHYGAKWIGTDISENQIEQAKCLSKGMDIEYYVCSAENLDFPVNSFNVITACQCIWYLDHSITAPKFSQMLKEDGRFLIMYMGWLPFEDEIAGKSEKLILKYNPAWNGCGDTVHPVWVPDEYIDYFDLVNQEEFCVNVSFTRESWHGRMRACRGTSASMMPEELASWDAEHRLMLEEYPEEFKIKHYISIAILKKK